MDTDRFVVALLNSLPDRTVKGKKRLQKLVFLLTDSGAECSATFKMKDFGPFSPQVEKSTNYLALVGDLEEREEQVGYAHYLASVFTLSDSAREAAEQLPERYKSMLGCLNRFTTLELEIAATIRYFERSGETEDNAVQFTRAMKPTKTKEQILERARSALKCLVQGHGS